MPKKTNQELAKMHWKDRYEYEAGGEFSRFSKLSERELIEKIKKNQIGFGTGF